MIIIDMEQTIRRHKSIDHLKAFAIILVVFYHALFQTDISYGNLTNICLTIGLRSVHVPLFILIAGYLCHKQPVLQFWRKKLFRILIPFLFFTILKLILNNLLNTEYLHGNGVWSQLWDAFFCGSLYWYCYCLLVLFLIAPLLWNRRVLQWVLLGILLAANILVSTYQIPLTDILQLQNVLFYSPYFILGMLLSGYAFPGVWNDGSRQEQEGSRKQKNRKGVWICTGLAAAGVLVTGYLRFILDVGDGSYLTDFVFGICVMYLLYLLTFATLKGNVTDKLLGPIGRWSLQIMLLDPFWRVAVYELFRRILPDGMLLAVLVTLADLLLSYATCSILRRIPVLSFLTGLKQRESSLTETKRNVKLP